MDFERRVSQLVIQAVARHQNLDHHSGAETVDAYQIESLIKRLESSATFKEVVKEICDLECHCSGGGNGHRCKCDCSTCKPNKDRRVSRIVRGHL